MKSYVVSDYKYFKTEESKPYFDSHTEVKTVFLRKNKAIKYVRNYVPKREDCVITDIELDENLVFPIKFWKARYEDEGLIVEHSLTVLERDLVV